MPPNSQKSRKETLQLEKTLQGYLFIAFKTAFEALRLGVEAVFHGWDQLRELVSFLATAALSFFARISRKMRPTSTLS